MYRAVLAGLVSAAALAPSAASAGPPPLPCNYWVHGCNVLEYVCDTPVCAAISLPPTTASFKD
jgi:hypothetical protein